MRIEILVDDQEPKIYPLDRVKIVVGSHESCDIVIQHKSISRKHLIILNKEDKFYVADQGSTNGSYIDEHRLVPGNSAEFTSFFPVRLGDNVLVSLLSDEEAQDLGPDSAFNSEQSGNGSDGNESTKMISLNDLAKSSTSGLVLKRNETVAKRKTSIKKVVPVKKKASASNSMMALIGAILIGSAAYYQVFVKNSNQNQVVEVQKIKVRPTPIVDQRPVKRIDESQMLSSEKILAGFKNPKCDTEIEKYFCTILPMVNQGIWGTVIVENSIVIMVDGDKYGAMAKGYLKEPFGQHDLGLVSLMLWMKENVPVELKKFEGLKDLTITVAVVDASKEEPSLVTAVFFVPESFLRLREAQLEKHFTDAKKTGALEFSYAFDYLRFL